ncbi:MAG: peptidase C69 [Candidatus Lokiarchaeota archaeon]|nr:peptidase C69 [Candidatus Lokiarchaeota archaeon]
MCDTLVALGNSTLDGSVIFGKNSDRPDDEVQLVTYHPRMHHDKNSKVQCTYISIPQVSETAAIIMSQPYWMYGCEMGCSENNVVIGNEAVHTYEPLRANGLLGMDLLRLGLERGKTAEEALNIITNLLVKYHQGGGCALGNSGWTYHNSFIIADEKEAYILETADDWWIAEIVKDVRSISNGLSIRGKGDIRRKGIIQHAIEKEYCKDDNQFDFAATFSGTKPSKSPHSRYGKSSKLLKENRGQITPSMMMGFLREHSAGLCMHGGFESTGSQISHLRSDNHSINWFSGSTLPCLSLYKPYSFPVRDQEVLAPGPYSEINEKWFWVQHSKYIDKIKRYPYSDSAEYKNYEQKRKQFEGGIYKKVNNLLNQKGEISKEAISNSLCELNKKAWELSKDLIKK